MSLFRKKLSSINEELKLIAKLCKENIVFRKQFEQLLSQQSAVRNMLIEQWYGRLPEESELRSALTILKDDEIATAMLAELREGDHAQ
jgi:hypothetical protein